MINRLSKELSISQLKRSWSHEAWPLDNENYVVKPHDTCSLEIFNVWDSVLHHVARVLKWPYFLCCMCMCCVLCLGRNWCEQGGFIKQPRITWRVLSGPTSHRLCLLFLMKLSTLGMACKLYRRVETWRFRQRVRSRWTTRFFCQWCKRILPRFVGVLVIYSGLIGCKKGMCLDELRDLN